MIRVASRLPPAAFAWLPVPVFRAVIVFVLVFDSVVNTLWAPFRAVGIGAWVFLAELLESVMEPWRFWIPCTCVKNNEFMASLPSKRERKHPTGPTPDCDFCHGRGGIGLWASSGKVARKMKGAK